MFTRRYGKYGSLLTRTFSGVSDLSPREFKFAHAAPVTFSFAQVSLPLFNIIHVSYMLLTII